MTTAIINPLYTALCVLSGLPPLPPALRTNAAIDPNGVVVVLRHAGVAGEAVVGSHWFLCLQTEQHIRGLAIAVPITHRGLLFEAHHAGSAENSGVQAAGFGQQQNVLTTKTNRTTSTYLLNEAL